MGTYEKSKNALKLPRNRKMKIRFFFNYGITMAIAFVLFCVLLMAFTVNNAQKNYYMTTGYEVDTINTSLQELYGNMEYMITFLLSDPDNLTSIKYLSRPMENMTTKEMNNSLSYLRQSLSSYCIDKYFYRVCFYNKNGMFTSSNYLTRVFPTESVKQAIEINSIYENLSYAAFYGKQDDAWDDGKNPTEVVGMVRRIFGDNMGYFEIQVKYDYFAGLFQRPFTYDIMLSATLNGELIYSSFSDPGLESGIYSAAVTGQEASYQGYMASSREYEINGDKLKIYYALPTSALIGDTLILLIAIMVVMLVLVGFSLVFMQLYKRRMVLPINHLKAQMDQTGIENLTDSHINSNYSTTIDEIAHLYKGYNRLIDRIRDGHLREKKLEELQMRSQLDTLQAQVNPHFINNTLNVISYRGMLLEDNTICEICSNISQMLKYSTDTKQKIVTVKVELEYVRFYMELLKYRYGEKFIYTIDCEPLIEGQALPKIVIQQLVENSIMHGFGTPYEIMEIQIKGWAEGDIWFVKVSDNGSGFDPEILAKLKDDKETIQKEIISGGRIQDMEIGGMGLINTYTRLLLLYNSDFTFDFYNDNGAVVVLSFKMEGLND